MSDWMESGLVYVVYVAAAFGALATFVALPKQGKPTRRGLALLLTAMGGGALVMLIYALLGEAANRISIYVLALLSVGAAIRVVTHRNPVFSALYFVMVVLATAALMVLVGAEFLAFALVIVYAGAILVTYVFVIMLAQQSTMPEQQRVAAFLDYDRSAREPFWAVVAGFLFTATVAATIARHPWPAFDDTAAAEMAKDNTLSVGRMLMTDFTISLELGGVLLLVAMIGAIAIAKKRIPHADDGLEHLPPGEIGKRVKPF